MTNIDVITFCNHFYNSTNVPIRYYESDTIKLQLPFIEAVSDPFTPFYHTLVHQPQTITYLVTKHFLYYGVIKTADDTNNCIVLGPITDSPASKEMIREIMLDASIPLSQTIPFTELFHKFPLFAFDRFLHFLCFIHYTVNHISLSIDNILDYKNQKILFPIASEHTIKSYNAKEDHHFHNTYQFEKQYLNIIENGDLASLKKLLDNPIIITPGIVADNSIRQIKNLFIAGTTLVTRAAIKGGMDMESAYQLSDVYIQQMERMQSIEAIYNLQYQMMFDYTERVLAAKIPAGISLDVYECINYINVNTNRPITVEEVADNVKKSRSFLSRKFKQELGFGINDYITSRKIEEAKNLLTYTNKSISEISFYLCFSSQSYFQNVFKKKLGLTPNEYRIKTQAKNEIV